MLEAYKDDKKTDFKYLHVFLVVEGCEKLDEACRTRRQSRPAPPTPRPTPPKGTRPPNSGGRRSWTSKVKLDLLRTGTEAKKRNHDIAFLVGGGDPDTMDPEVRAWF